MWIGTRPCEQVLEKILDELKDPKKTRYVMVRLHRLRDEFKKLECIKDKSLRNKLTTFCFKDVIDNFDKSHNLPKNLRTHALCCYKALHRDALKIEIEDKSEDTGNLKRRLESLEETVLELSNENNNLRYNSFDLPLDGPSDI